MDNHTLKAAHPAAIRALWYLLLMVVFLAVGFFWATDGLQRYPSWDDVREWLVSHHADPQK